MSYDNPAEAAPASATFLVVSLTSALTGERVLVAGTGLTSSDGGANGNFTISLASSFANTLMLMGA